MNITINIVEVASELAHKELEKIEKLSERYDLPNPFPNGIFYDVSDDMSIYTEDAQKIFNELYDDYYNFLIDLKEE